jgi:hypothetical protein
VAQLHRRRLLQGQPAPSSPLFRPCPWLIPSSALTEPGL